MPPFILKLLTNKHVLAGLGVVLVVSTLYGVYQFQKSQISRLENKLENLKVQLIQKEIAVQSLESKMNLIEDSVDRSAKLTKNLSEETERVRRDIDDKMKVFEGERLKSLAAKKPGLIEKKVNNATLKVFEQIEEETRTFKETNE